MGKDDFSTTVNNIAIMRTLISVSNFDELFKNRLEDLKTIVPYSNSIVCLNCDKYGGYSTTDSFSNDIEDDYYVKLYNDKYAQMNTVHKYFNIIKPLAVRKSDDVNKESLDKSKFKKEWLDELNLYYEADMIICSSGINYGTICLYRAAGELDFNDKEITILKDIAGQYGVRLYTLLSHDYL